MPIRKYLSKNDNKARAKEKVEGLVDFYKTSGFSQRAWADVRTAFNSLSNSTSISNREPVSSFLPKINTVNDIIDNPPLDINFINNTFTVNSTTSTFDSAFTFSATTNTTMFDSSGTLVWAPHNIAPYSDDASQWLSAVGGTGTGPVVTSNVGEAPNGETIADRVQFDRGAGGTANDYSLKSFVYNEDFSHAGEAVIWVKSNTGANQTFIIYNNDSIGSTHIATASWQRFTIACSGNVTRVANIGTRGGTGSYFNGGDETLDLLVAHAGAYYTAPFGMADNPDQPAGLEKYVPTISSAVYGARRQAHYYDNGWKNGGLQLETARTNVILNSNDFSGWTIVRSSFSSGAATGPDGVSGSAWKFIEDGSNDGHYAYLYAGTPTDNYWVWSCYIKDAGDSRYLALRFRTSGGSSPIFQDVVFDPTDGSVYNPGGVLETGFENIGNGWFRVWATADVGDATGFLMPLIGLSNLAEPAVNPAAPTYQGDNTSGVYIYGMQFEEGRLPSSYIPTTGSSVTRAVENLQMSGANTPIKKETGAMYFDALVSYSSNSPGCEIFNTASPLGNIFLLNTPHSYLRWSGGASPVVRAAGLIPFGLNQPVKAAFTYAENDKETMAINGSLGSYVPTTTLLDYSNSTITRFFTGYSSTTGAFFKEFRAWDIDIGSSKNLNLYSEDFSDWDEEYTMTIDNAATTVNGITMSRLNTSASSRQSVRKSIFSANNDTTLSVYAKADGGQYLQIIAYDSGTNQSYVVFDLVNGTITETSAVGGHTLLDSSIIAEPNGVYRCVFSYIPVDYEQSIYIIVSPTGTPGGFPTTSPGVDNDILIGGLQLEPGQTPTSYHRTPSISGGGIEYLTGDAYSADGYSPELVADFVGVDSLQPYFRKAGFNTDFSSLFTYSTTTPRTMFNSDGILVWNAHNLAINSDSPATQSITVIDGATYTVAMTGTGSFALTGAGSGVATEANPVTFVSTGTTLTITLSGSATRIWVYRSDLGGMADNPDWDGGYGLEKYVPTAGSVVYKPRRDAYYYDSATSSWTLGGLQMEAAAATNLATYSRDLTNAAWTVTSAATVTKNAVGIDGVENSACTVTKTGTGSGEGIYEIITIPANTSTYQVSVFVPYESSPTNYPVMRVQMTGGVGQNNYYAFNTTTGVSTLASGSGGAVLVQRYGDWWRVSIQMTNGGSETGLRLYLYPRASANGTTIDWTQNGSLVFDQIDMCVGTAPSSPIITTGSTVTRAAETLDISSSNHGLTNLPFSIQAKYIRGAPNTYGGRVWNLRNGSRITEMIDYSSGGEFYSVDGNRDGIVGVLSNTIGEVVNMAAYTNNNATEYALNGSASGTPGPGLNSNTSWASTTMLIGRYYLPNYEHNTNFYQQIRIWNRSLSQVGIEQASSND